MANPPKTVVLVKEGELATVNETVGSNSWEKGSWQKDGWKISDGKAPVAKPAKTAAKSVDWKSFETSKVAKFASQAGIAVGPRDKMIAALDEKGFTPPK